MSTAADGPLILLVDGFADAREMYSDYLALVAQIQTFLKVRSDPPRRPSTNQRS